LIAGIALGAKTSLSQELWEKLRSTGTAHVVVASGFNVSLVTSFLIGFLLIFLKRRKAVTIAIAGIWVYTLVSGFDAPIVRAAVMGTIAFTAQEFGRLYSAWNALVISGLIMLIAVPDWVGDLGFILSFVATASLLLFYKRVDKVFAFLPKILREGLTTSTAAQIGVGPILFVTFGSFNMLSPLINGIVLWTIPYITILGMMGGVIGLFVPILGKAILLMSLPLTTWFLSIVNLFS
jgi:competence protein ComEC